MGTRTLLRRLVLFGVPLILGCLEIFHPVLGTSGIVATLSPQVNWWLTLHLLQLLLFGLLAVAVLLLTMGLPGWVTTISRIGVWFFVVFYMALDTLAGARQWHHYPYGTRASSQPAHRDRACECALFR